MKNPAATNPLRVTSEEVLGWFRRHRQPWPSEPACEALAFKMNRMLRLEPPSAEFVKYHLSAEQGASAEKLAERWWDVDIVADAANLVLEALPKLIGHWEKLQWSPETADGYRALIDLQTALSKAMPYIEAPFGEFEPLVGYKPPKTWHSAAMILFVEVGKMLAGAGHQLPDTPSRNTILVQITREAILRLTIKDGRPEAPALAQFLDRFGQRGGMTTKHIAGLCSQDRP